MKYYDALDGFGVGCETYDVGKDVNVCGKDTQLEADISIDKKSQWNKRRRAIAAEGVKVKKGANEGEPCCFRYGDGIRCGTWVRRSAVTKCSDCPHHMCMMHKWPDGEGRQVCPIRAAILEMTTTSPCLMRC